MQEFPPSDLKARSWYYRCFEELVGNKAIQEVSIRDFKAEVSPAPSTCKIKWPTFWRNKTSKQLWLILNKKHREKNVWLFHAEQYQIPHCIFLSDWMYLANWW